MNEENRKPVPNAVRRKEASDEETNRVSGGVFTSTGGSWTCKSCNASNSMLVFKCASCGEDKGGTLKAHIPM